MTDPFNCQIDELHEILWQQATDSGFGRFHIKVDPQTQLFAIIALHSTKLGPALGGCRMVPYQSVKAAFYDAMSLARSMSYKSVLADVPIGGGKTVIVQPQHIKDRQALMAAYGRFVNELNGQYITAVDSGTTIDDMDQIVRYTPYVATCSEKLGDPSPYTAWGTVRGIEAAVKARFGHGDLRGLRVLVQGVGHVGIHLVRMLKDQGAELLICDISEQKAQSAAHYYGAHKVALADMMDQAVDVFAPCALGGVVNAETVERFNMPVIAGAVNNLFSEQSLAQRLHERGILCAPDYVINGGGLMFAADRYHGLDTDTTWAKVDNIYDTLLDIFHQAQTQAISPSQVADALAETKLRAKPDDTAAN